MNENNMYYMPPYQNINPPLFNPLLMQEEINKLKREIKRLEQRINTLEKNHQTDYKNNYNFDDGMYMV